MRLPLLAALTLAAAPLHAQADSSYRAWNQPVAPFRIAGNLYYVGALEVSSFLITTDVGLIVIDGGFEETAPQILANIQALGFRPADVKFLLSSHGHLDHAGGFAALKRATGATLVAAEGDAVLIENGGRGDFAFGDRLTFERAAVDRRIKGGETVRLGGTTVTALLTPGHTKGCTTWTLTVRDGNRDLSVAVVCSLSAPGYQLAGNAANPRIVQDYEGTFRRLEQLRPDIFLSAHGSAFGLAAKMARAAAGASVNPFVDAAEFPEYLARAERAFRNQLAQQAATPRRP